jgi:hypothetical protein
MKFDIRPKSVHIQPENDRPDVESGPRISAVTYTECHTCRVSTGREGHVEQLLAIGARGSYT